MTFRSQEMSHHLLIVPDAHAYETINQLSQGDLVHMADCGDSSNRPFYSQLKRCDENILKIQTIKEAVLKRKHHFEQFEQSQPGFVEELCRLWKTEAKNLGIVEEKLIDQYESTILEEYTSYQELTSRLEKLQHDKQEALEKIACYEAINLLLGSSNIQRESKEYWSENAVQDKIHTGGISYLVGIVDSQMEPKLNRMIFRVSRGYACTKTLDYYQFEGLQQFREKVVLVIYPTSHSSILEKKILRVIQTFCRSYMGVNDIDRNSKSMADYKAKYSDAMNYIEMNERELDEFLERVQQLGCLEKWRLFFWKERYLYDSLNKMEVRGQFCIAELYTPSKNVPALTHLLSRITPTPTLQKIQATKPPTSFNTNSFTNISQQIIDTYGVPRYQEFNPSIFTCVTFPFFFGVMFGDMAHGGVLFALGLVLIFWDEQIRKSPLKVASELRYMVALMGFFAFYCGWIYNDFIGYNLNIFGSCYDPPLPPDDDEKGSSILKPQKPISQDCMYPFGIDPIWGRAENELVFVNSLKMKLSVIIGVLHMILGICVKAANSIYFRKKLDFYFQFIPQILFMTLLFGYMDFLIVFKWLKVFDEHVTDIPPVQWAPSIIGTMMNIGMGLGKTSTEPNGTSNMWGQRGHTSQDAIQLFILLIAVICIPVMLFPKPIIQIKGHKKRKQHYPLGINELESELQEKMIPNSQITSSDRGDNSKEAQHDAGQIFVHQLIETIQFVLGAISNTASYLRLWALSLAHSQLAKVFFQKTLESGFGEKVFIGVPAMIVMFYLLAWITFGILMSMDTMECFLHSLRLHWVEFQNKFYKGDGYGYSAMSLKKNIHECKEKSIK